MSAQTLILCLLAGWSIGISFLILWVVYKVYLCREHDVCDDPLTSVQVQFLKGDSQYGANLS